MGAMRLVLDRLDQGVPTEVGTDRLGELLANRENRLWLDISDPGPAEVALLRHTFGFHELVLEDVTRAHERPRCDAYSGYYFIVVYAAQQSGDVILPQELNLFWGENYLVTIHRRGAAVLTALTEAGRRWEHRQRHQVPGIAGLVYTLFESLVDGYFAIQDRVRERIEGIEEAIFTGAEGAAVDLFRLRKELLRVPRLLAPTSHVLAEVLRREGTVPESLRPYFAAFNRLGRIMQRLTAITVIIMVPNFVASIYGMNFVHLIPSSESTYGFVVIVAFLMVMVGWGFIHSRMMRWL